MRSRASQIEILCFAMVVGGGERQFWELIEQLDAMSSSKTDSILILPVSDSRLHSVPERDANACQQIIDISDVFLCNNIHSLDTCPRGPANLKQIFNYFW